MAARSKFEITGEIVAEGSLGKNPQTLFYLISFDRRADALRGALVVHLSKIIDEKARARASEDNKTSNHASEIIDVRAPKCEPCACEL